MNVTFARVRASEASRLSEFARDNFEKTYKPLCRAEDVDAYAVASLSPSALLGVLTNPAAWVFAAVVDDAWVGYAHVQLSSLPEGVRSASTNTGASLTSQGTSPGTTSVTPMELARFYVDRAFHGTDVSRKMLEIVLAHAELQGAPAMWLSVWKQNARAIAFYRKRGFQTIGEGNFLMGEDLQDDFIMERAVQPLPLVNEP